MKKLLTTGTLTSYRPRTDGSFNITVNIQIPSKDQKGVIDDLFQQEVVVYLREGSEVSKEEIEIIDDVDIELGNKKTDHQRLSSVWFLLWKKNPEGFKIYSDYYHFMMSRIIEHYKGKIDD